MVTQRAENNKAVIDADNCRKDTVLVKVKLSDAEKNLAVKSDELALERDKNLALMKEMSDLRKQINDLLDENKLMKENEISQNEEFEVCELELVEAKAEASKVVALESEIEKLRAELKKDSPPDVVNLRLELEVNQRELSDMYVNYDKQTGELQKALKDLDKAHSENVKLKKELDCKAQDYAKVSDDDGKNFERIRELEKLLQQALHEIDEREQDVADVEQNYQLAQRDYREAREDLDKLRKRVAELEALLGL